MEFRLLYSGELPGSGNKSRPEVKHRLRQSFHPQLRRLWHTNRGLKMLLKHEGETWLRDHPVRLFEPGLMQYTDDEYFDAGTSGIAERWARNGFKFIPLVTESLTLRCSLDITFLRPEEPHLLIQGGDLDGRVKTIFDSLRMPSNPEETGGIGPQHDETPFFCLLEDDKLISEIRVTTDELLLLPMQRQVKPTDVFTVIHVKIKPAAKGGLVWNLNEVFD